MTKMSLDTGVRGITFAILKALGSVLDGLGYLPFAQSGGQLLFHLVSRLYELTTR
jgi:hypothetical protein